MCGETFTKAVNFNKHMWTHRPNQHKCKLCGERFKNRVLIEKHMINSHNNKKNLYKCVQCEVSFESECNLMKHIKKHTIINQGNVIILTMTNHVLSVKLDVSINNVLKGCK